MLERAQARGHLQAQWVAGDSAFGMSPALREGRSATGLRYVLDVRPDLTVWPLEPTWSNPPYQGNGRPRQPKSLREERQTMAQRSLALPEEAWREITIAAGSLALPEEAWREITIAAGSQGPRAYRYSAQRVRVTRQRKPGEILWAIYRRNQDGHRTPLLLVQRSRGHAFGNPGPCGRLPLAHRNRVRDREERRGNG